MVREPIFGNNALFNVRRVDRNDRDHGMAFDPPRGFLNMAG